MVYIGERFPDVKVMTMTSDGPKEVQTNYLLGKGRVILFAVPGAFTPVCSDYHLPGFVLRAPEFRAKGISKIACVSVNDPFVMEAWAKAMEATDDVIMLADVTGQLTSAMGLEADANEFGLGIRSHRYVVVLDDGVITHLQVEQHFTDHVVSTAEAILNQL